MTYVSKLKIFSPPDRYQKEVASSHLSPLKKRVKENTPPQVDSHNNNGGNNWSKSTAASSSSNNTSSSSSSSHHHNHHHHHHHHHRKSSKKDSHQQHQNQSSQQQQTTRQIIEINDTPSPSVSVITISSDEDNGEEVEEVPVAAKVVASPLKTCKPDCTACLHSGMKQGCSLSSSSNSVMSHTPDSRVASHSTVPSTKSKYFSWT